MGLLDSVLVQQSGKKKSSPLSSKFQNRAADFYSGESVLPEDLTYPDKVLTLLQKFLSIDKLLVVLYHAKSDVWLPLTAAGLDVTSTRRIRFNNHLFSSLFPESFSLLENSEQLAFFKPLLSMREFSMLEKIEVVYPKTTRNNPTTALIILNNDTTLNGIKELLFTVQKIDTILRENRSPEETTSSISPFVSQFLSKTGSRKTYLFKIDYEEIILFIQETLTEEFEKKQLTKDIFDTIYSMISASGRLLQIDNYSSLLLYSSTSIHNPKLLITQITNTIKNYYNIQTNVPSISDSFLTYPDDGEDADTLLRQLHIT